MSTIERPQTCELPPRRTMYQSQRRAYLRDAEVVPALPANGQHGDSVHADLVGSTIIRFGTPEDFTAVEGSGLVIGYLPKGQSGPRRLVLALNDSGMWVEYHSRQT